jgi:hypothetical protein
MEVEKLKEFMKKEGYSAKFTTKVVNEAKKQVNKAETQDKIYNASIGLMIMCIVSLIVLWCSV